MPNAVNNGVQQLAGDNENGEEFHESSSVGLTQPPQQVPFTYEAFDPETSTWTRWVERFETALEIFNCWSGRKKKYLLHFMGSKTYNVLCDRIYPKHPAELIYDEIVKELKEYYDPEPNEILENYRFHLRKQLEDESCEEFVKELRRLSAHCNFGNYLSTALRNQFIFGLRHNGMRIRLLEKKNLTLNTAIDIAKAMESSSRGGAEIQSEKSVVNSVHMRDKGKHAAKKKACTQNAAKAQTSTNTANTSKRSRTCFRCGNSSHLANSCSHANTVCNFCKVKGHLQVVCFKRKKAETNQIEETGECQHIDELLPIYEASAKTVWAEDVHPVYTDLLNIQNSNLRSKFMYNLNVNNVCISFEIDSGAPVTIMSLADSRRYFGELKLHANDIGLQSYCHSPIDVIGFSYVNVATEPKSPKVKLYIARSDRRPLLGREWLRQINLDWKTIFHDLIMQPIPTLKYINQTRSTIQMVQQIKVTQNADTSATRKNTNTITNTRLHDTKAKLQQIIQRYERLFSKSTGTITGTQARLHLKQNQQSKFFKARRVPFPYMQAVEAEIEKLVTDGIFEKVEASEWATPIVPVPKGNGEVRICGDYKVTVNQALLIDEYPLPTIDELFCSMAGGDKFSKIDLSKAYLQMEVHPDDRHLLTLNTHKGLYQPTRLMFGVASAPAKFQKYMDTLLSDIPGVTIFLDDIKITAENDELHVQRLKEVLRRLHDHNMRVNLDKSEFMKEQIIYCGYMIDRKGIHKVEEKMEAIVNMKIPSNRDEVRSFCGFINYYAKFLPNLSSILFPINQLLRLDTKFNWSKECDVAFNEIKRLIKSDLVLAHYDPKQTLVLATDAGPYGVGAVLSHEYKDGTERPIQFASQTLSPTQQRYSQIDREAYAIIYGVRKFYQYLYGRHFILVTDNKPLAQIFAPDKSLPVMSATRMQHYAIFLSSFDYEIRVKKSRENANADAMSRLPNPAETYNYIEEIEVIEVNTIETLPVTVRELAEITEKETVVRNLIQALKHGRRCEAKDRYNIEQTEFTLQQGCLLRGIRVFIPSPLRDRVLQELHSAHFGITKMKSLARGYCWWPNMDSDIEKLVLNCRECQSVRPEPKKVITHYWNRPSEPWERVHADFAGPIQGLYLFILVDAYTKWPEVHVINNITAGITIEKCREIFATFGLPKYFVSDWGTQFTSQEFQSFLTSNGIQHKKGAPYHPATNGQAERYVQTIKNKLKAIKGTKGDMKRNIANILLAYRRATHPLTGRSPAMMMMGRQIESRLDLLIPHNANDVEKQPDGKKKFDTNDNVAVRDYLSSDKWKFGTVEKKVGDLHYEVRLEDGRNWKRHVDQMKKVGEQIAVKPKDSIVDTNTHFEPTKEKPAETYVRTMSPKQTTTVVSQESTRDTMQSNFNSPDTSMPSAEGLSGIGVPLDSGNLRRSERNRRPPERLEYKSFK